MAEDQGRGTGAPSMPADAPPPGVPVPISERQLLVAAAAGVVGAIGVPGFAPGLGLAVTGLVGAAAVVVARGRWGVAAPTLPSPPAAPNNGTEASRIAGDGPSDPVAAGRFWRWGAGAIAVAGSALPAISDAGWVAALVLAAAIGLGVYATGGGTRWRAIVLPPLRTIVVAFEALTASVRRTRASSSRARLDAPWVRATLLSAVLLLVFGTLFASADRVFGRLVDRYLLPDLDLRWLPLRIVVFGVLVAGITTLTLLRPDASDERLTGPPRRQLRGVEWQLPLGSLVALFTIFVIVQFQALFGGHERVLETAGLTYAEYAHQGFGQLIVVAALTLAVVDVVARYARPTSRAQRRVRAGLLAALCLLTLVVLASAMHRLVVYGEAYGATRLRLSAQAIVLWLGAVFVAVLVTAAVRRTRWLPPVLVLVTGLAVVAFGYARPDALIADANVDRFEETGRIDVDYLRWLSADAVPPLERLPEDVRVCVMGRQAQRLAGDDAPRGWGAWNLSRSRATHHLDESMASADCSPWLETSPRW